MNPKDTKMEVKRLVQDVEYYNNVFKKVEKISSVIFYILSFKSSVSEKSVLEKSLENKSFKAHELSLETLNVVNDKKESLYALRQALLSLMSSVQVATAARELAEDMSLVIVEQIDAVQRYITNHYLNAEGISMEDLYKVAVENTPVSKISATQNKPSSRQQRQRRQQRVVVPSGDISSDAYMVYSQLNDRSQRIKTVLEAKPQATVKDIAEIITDVSEKTIQRDLNSLIAKGQVIREGERRWSKYSVIKD